MIRLAVTLPAPSVIITATSCAGQAWFRAYADGSVAWGMGGNQPVALADAVWKAFHALQRRRVDQAEAALRAAFDTVEVRGGVSAPRCEAIVEVLG